MLNSLVGAAHACSRASAMSCSLLDTHWTIACRYTHIFNIMKTRTHCFKTRISSVSVMARNLTRNSHWTLSVEHMPRPRLYIRDLLLSSRTLDFAGRDSDVISLELFVIVSARNAVLRRLK